MRKRIIIYTSLVLLIIASLSFSYAGFSNNAGNEISNTELKPEPIRIDLNAQVSQNEVYKVTLDGPSVFGRSSKK